MDTIVILASSPGTPPLDAETRVFTFDRKCIGVIYETFGPVKQPFYSVLFDSPQVIKASGIKIGQPLYCSPADNQLTQFVFLRDIKKGSDASWIDDKEPPAEAVEFSDDETEQRVRAVRKAVNKANKQDTGGDTLLSNDITDQQTIYTPVNLHNEQFPTQTQAMNTQLTTANIQISRLVQNTTQQNQVNPVLNVVETSTHSNEQPNLHTDNDVILMPSEQQGIFPIPTDSTEPNLHTENDVILMPSEQQGIFPIPSDSTEPNLHTENEVILMPSEQQGIFPIPTDSTEPNLHTENDVILMPSEQQGIFPIPTDSTEPILHTENEVILMPSEQQGIFPIPTDSTEPILHTENEVILMPSEQQGIFPIPSGEDEIETQAS